MQGIVRDVLSQKGNQVFVTAPSVSVRQAVRTMAEQGIGALLVLESGEVAGIFSERDVLNRVVDEGRAPKLTRVRDVMTPEVQCVTPDMAIDDAVELMLEERTRHLVVVEDGYVAGLISIGDLLRHLRNRNDERIGALGEQIGVLTEYITGQRPA